MSFINSISQAFVQELHRFVYVSVCSVLKVDFDICYLFCCRNQCLNRKIKPLIKFFVWYQYEGLCNLFTKKVSCGKTRVFPGFFFLTIMHWWLHASTKHPWKPWPLYAFRRNIAQFLSFYLALLHWEYISSQAPLIPIRWIIKEKTTHIVNGHCGLSLCFVLSKINNFKSIRNCRINFVFLII